MRQIDADALKEELELKYKIGYENDYKRESPPDNDRKMRLDTVEEVIDNTPTVNKWTPVKEAMPEETVDEWGEQSSDLCLTQCSDNEGHPYFILNWTVKGEWELDSHVIAWFPLPEPYEGK